MKRMTSSVSLSLLLTAMLIGRSDELTVSIMPPLLERLSGPDVGLIFIPGANINGSAYGDTAIAIQEACELRLWVALTSSYDSEMPNPTQLPQAIAMATNRLQEEGMKGKQYVGIAHSLGGMLLAPYAMGDPNLQAVVLLGAYLKKGNPLGGYPHPLLTLSGELDGQVRITRIAVAYEELQNLLLASPDAMYTKPVINIKGSNHSQFASGPMPPEIEKYDLPADITTEEAHQAIGRHVGDFITYQLGQNHTEVSKAKANLKISFQDSAARFQPLLDMKSVDQFRTSSGWAMVIQELVANDTVNITTVNNVIEYGVNFTKFQPTLVKSSGRLTVNTSTQLSYAKNPLDISIIPESPRDVQMKMKSTEAFVHARNSTRFSETDQKPNKTKPYTCMDENKAALDSALTFSSSDARKRFLSRGRPIIFKKDIVENTELSWHATNFNLTESDAGLTVQAVALKTSINDVKFPGMFYCKLISAFTAMEWVHVDSLRPKKP